MPLPLAAVFAELPDPRRETRNKLHALTDVLTLATCAVISGAESWDDIHAYATCKEDFFRRFLPLANGIPSADTFERVPDDWRDVDAVVRVFRERVVDGVRTSTTHYAMSSHPRSAEEMGGFVRGHWGIEAMHWVLDVVYGEDDSRVRAGHAGANLAMLRKVAIALTRRAPGKGSGKTKRNKAGWDDGFLLQVLQGIPPLKTKT